MIEDNQVLINATNITSEQLESFYKEVQKIPSERSPIKGFAARLAFEFMEDTGLRVNELIHVRKMDINFQTMVLTVIMPKISKRCSCSRWKNKNEYSKAKILDYANPVCSDCHGSGRYKRPQKTTITPRIKDKLYLYCESFRPIDLLFPISRVSLWKWAKKAGNIAGLNVFVSKDEKEINNMFNHFFRALCTIRMKKDAKDEEYRDELIMTKRRDTFDKVMDRYTKIDINYLLQWEAKTYLI